MNCPNCQTSLESDAKFCTSCGVKIDHIQTENSNTEPVQSTGTTAKQTPDYVQQGKEISKQYWNFIPSALANPFAASKHAGPANKINAMITLILFSLLIPLFSYISLSSYFRPPFVEMVVQPFFIFVIFFALLLAVKYGVAKLMKADVSFINVMTRFGIVMVLPTTTALVAVLFAILGIDDFSIILLIVSMGLASIASLATIFSIKEKAPVTGGLDVFYGVVLTYVAMTIILLIIGDSILYQLENSFYGF
ncbi:zinc ribbon domain-containing protein [Paraliobacillus sediminis]|uniref:zinc ribbon domain-containing protein n=1 Tax=Paraliobacillus sediminis TaxID=1885916 RepID=UPI000E3ED817|nr:zinc ribbon domain-containing protein [Paraliobacillus sediminis]